MQLKLISLGVISSLIMSCQADSEVAETTETKAPLEVKVAQDKFAKLDQYFATLAEKEKVLGSFAIYKDGKQVYDKAYIIHDKNYQESEETYRYKIGLISKTFTAALVFQLIDQGKLTLDTKLAKFYPEIKNADKITIQMMLNHHSGIFNYTNHEDFTNYYQEAQSTAAMVERISAFDSDFEPGEKGEYSNSNYLLLGYILETITGKDYGELMLENIAKPLGLKETYLEETTEPEKKEVFSFIKNDGWQQFPQWQMSTADAAGAIVSTTHDLNVFFKGLFDDKLMSEESFNTMIEIKNTYGHGIFKRETETDGETLVGYWHNGRIEKFSSGMFYFPEQRIGVAGLMNADLYDGAKVFRNVVKTAFGRDIEIPEFKVINLTEDQLKKYVGRYKSDTHPLGINVIVESGELKAQADGQGAFPLTAIDDDTFDFSAAGIEIKFNPEDKQFVIKQGGRADIFVATEAEKQAATVAVDSAILETYVGLYKKDGFPLDIEVLIKDGALHAQATGQPAFPLTAVSDTEFKFDLAGITIVFDSANKQLAITQGGNTNIMTKE